MVDITGVSLDGRLLSSAAGVEAGSGSASVHVSFEAAMPAAGALAANFSALVFSRAADGLEASLALELATGALNFTVLGVGDLDATLEFVAAGTTALSDPAENAVVSRAELSALSMAVCVAVCCIGAFTWRRAGSRRRKSCKGEHEISDHDVGTSTMEQRSHEVVPAVESGTSTMEQLTERSHVLQMQPTPGEEDSHDPIAGLSCCQMTNPGSQRQPLRLKLGGLATIEGFWEMPWVSSEWRPLVEVNNLVDLTSQHCAHLHRQPGPPPRAAENSGSTLISL
jgi:hypothetical protein